MKFLDATRSPLAKSFAAVVIVLLTGAGIAFALTGEVFQSGSGYELDTTGTNTFDITTAAGTGGPLWLRSREAVSGGVFIDIVNNVGIGTTSPVTKLDVQGGHATFADSAGNAILYSGGAGSWYFRKGTPTSYTDLVTILNNGNVGIGTTSPGYKLDVSGTANFSQPIFVGPPSNPGHATTKSYVDSAVSAGSLWFVNGSNISNINTGNVGIGIASPGQKLEVAGNVSSTQFCLGGSCISAWSIGQWANGTGGAIYYNGGNVGIGTASPAHKLDVLGGDLGWGSSAVSNLLHSDQGGGLELAGLNASANPVAGGMPYIDFHYGTGGAQDYNVRLINAANNRLDITTNSGGTVLSVDGSNVGIGITSPGYKLDVSGTARFSKPVEVGTPTAGAHAATKAYVDAAVQPVSIALHNTIGGTDSCPVCTAPTYLACPGGYADTATIEGSCYQAGGVCDNLNLCAMYFARTCITICEKQ